LVKYLSPNKLENYEAKFIQKQAQNRQADIMEVTFIWAGIAGIDSSQKTP